MSKPDIKELKEAAISSIEAIGQDSSDEATNALLEILREAAIPLVESGDVLKSPIRYLSCSQTALLLPYNFKIERS